MKLLFPLILLLSGLLTTPCQAGKFYALVVGVSSYHPGQPLPPLPYTENDADGLAAVLKAGGYDVTLMTQTAGRVQGKEVLTPLSDYIRDQISAILDNPFLKEDDVVIVALAGHGVQYEYKDAKGNKSPKFYFCPADADVAKLQNANEITERNRLIDLGELYTMLSNSKAGGKLLLVDACRNDPTKPGVARTLASGSLPPLPPPPGGTAAFFSCSAHQQAFEDAELKHGVFFHHVIEALSGDADSSTAKRVADGQITLAELSEYVSSSTYDLVRKKFNGAKQAPELKGEFRVSIPLIAVKRSPAMPSPSPSPTPDRTPKQNDNEITNSIGMKLVLIKAGTFTMGSPESEKDRYSDETPHQVTLTKDFYLGSTEVTQGQWQAVMGTTPWKGKEYVKEGPNYPATYVSWEDAVEFCEKLRVKEGKEYRLPTEAEWENACRSALPLDAQMEQLQRAYDRSKTLFDAKAISRSEMDLAEISLKAAKANYNAAKEGITNTAYSFGTDSANLSEYGWFDKNAYNSNEKFAHEVGLKLANSFGLFDMHGNVWEWCSDWNGAYPTGSVTDPTGPSSGSFRVCRGGGWDNDAGYCRSANRSNFTPDVRSSSLGFRVALGR